MKSSKPKPKCNPKKTCGACENAEYGGKDGVVLCKMRVPMWYDRFNKLVPPGVLMRSDQDATKCAAFRWVVID